MNDSVKIKKLNEIKALLAKVSPYPWSYDENFCLVDSYDPKISVCNTDCAGKTSHMVVNDGKFISKSTENTEWLIGELEKAWGIYNEEFE